jgi:hypothetical protein
VLLLIGYITNAVFLTNFAFDSDIYIIYEDKINK